MLLLLLFFIHFLIFYRFCRLIGLTSQYLVSFKILDFRIDVFLFLLLCFYLVLFKLSNIFLHFFIFTFFLFCKILYYAVSAEKMALATANWRWGFRPHFVENAVWHRTQAKFTLVKLFLRVGTNSACNCSKTSASRFFKQFHFFSMCENAVGGAVFRMARHMFFKNK